MLNIKKIFSWVTEISVHLQIKALDLQLKIKLKKRNDCHYSNTSNTSAQKLQEYKEPCMSTPVVVD